LPSTIARDYIINILEVVVDQCIVKLLRDMRRAQLRMTQLEPFITDTPNQARSVDNKSAIDIRIRAQQRAHIGMRGCGGVPVPFIAAGRVTARTGQWTTDALFRGEFARRSACRPLCRIPGLRPAPMARLVLLSEG
jgi:hypothetical protein